MINFRQVDYPNHPTGIYWQVEWFPEHHPYRTTDFPAGLAFVMAMPGQGAQLNFIFVADQWRRQGGASAMIAACRQRWPGLMFTHGMGPEGEGLLAKNGVRFDEDEESAGDY